MPSTNDSVDGPRCSILTLVKNEKGEWKVVLEPYERKQVHFG
jgi:hypothetical protein